jgi:hypothetical protein
MLVGGALLWGCKSDNEIKAITINQAAVVTGDFDRVEEVLARYEVQHDVFEGYIDQAIYEEDVDPELMNPKVEALWLADNPDGDPLTVDYDAIFVNSGSRGLGKYVYNAVEEDNAFLIDPRVGRSMDAFTLRGGVLIVSDWSYDLVEALWPDKITFLNEDDGADAAQAGLDDTVSAEIVDPDLASAAGADRLDLAFDFSYWTVIREVSSDVTVHLRGDVQFRSSAGQGALVLEDVPLLVSFDTSNGRVILSSFAWKAQKAGVTDLILLSLLDGLDVQVQADQTASESE